MSRFRAPRSHSLRWTFMHRCQLSCTIFIRHDSHLVCMQTYLRVADLYTLASSFNVQTLAENDAFLTSLIFPGGMIKLWGLVGCNGSKMSRSLLGRMDRGQVHDLTNPIKYSVNTTTSFLCAAYISDGKNYHSLFLPQSESSRIATESHSTYPAACTFTYYYAHTVAITSPSWVIQIPSKGSKSTTRRNGKISRSKRYD